MEGLFTVQDVHTITSERERITEEDRERNQKENPIFGSTQEFVEFIFSNPNQELSKELLGIKKGLESTSPYEAFIVFSLLKQRLILLVIEHNLFSNIPEIKTKPQDVDQAIASWTHILNKEEYSTTQVYKDDDFFLSIDSLKGYIPEDWMEQTCIELVNQIISKRLPFPFLYSEGNHLQLGSITEQQKMKRNLENTYPTAIYFVDKETVSQANEEKLEKLLQEHFQDLTYVHASITDIIKNPSDFNVSFSLLKSLM